MLSAVHNVIPLPHTHTPLSPTHTHIPLPHTHTPLPHTAKQRRNYHALLRTHLVRLEPQQKLPQYDVI